MEGKKHHGLDLQAMCVCVQPMLGSPADILKRLQPKLLRRTGLGHMAGGRDNTGLGIWRGAETIRGWRTWWGAEMIQGQGGNSGNGKFWLRMEKSFHHAGE